MTHEGLCRYATYGDSIPSVLSLAIGLELILSSYRDVVKGTVLSELICAGLNSRSVTSRSLENGFGAIADHGEKGSVFRSDPDICSWRNSSALLRWVVASCWGQDSYP